MRYPLVPLVNELTFPLLFFWFCLPFVMLLIIAIIWLQLLLNEAQMPSAEKTEKESPDEPESDSEDELTEEENQSDASSTEMQEESQSSGAVGRLRPKPAYLSSNPKSQNLLAVTSNSWSQRQKIRYSRAEKSIFYNILMLLCSFLSSLTWNFVCLLLQTFNILRTLLLPSYLVTYVAQLSTLLGERAGKILGSLSLESRGLLLSVLGRKLQLSQAQRTTSG
ncbi:adipogenin [Zonotrichia leucophrys gambelii]|uniref:adipogenin n=1 Tax=Zonotrichia leucophrys gambelii TaxID=257770 RepID=UPI000393E341|nr:adipogenin isoform X1 [Zonotrichia albicollis]